MKITFRNFIDLTPFDKSGHSAFGLRRKQAKLLALVFIISGIILANPPGFSPDDFINFMLADFLFDTFNVFTYETFLLSTYTIIAWSLLIFGAWIYPYQTKGILNGYMKKAKKFIKKRFSSPKQIAISVAVFWAMYKIYQTYFFKGG